MKITYVITGSNTMNFCIVSFLYFTCKYANEAPSNHIMC